MASSSNILEDTIQQFFMNTIDSIDTSFNLFNQYQYISTPIFQNIQTQTQGVPQEDTDSMPDLIDSTAPTAEAPPAVAPASSDRPIQLWTNVLDDYHAQMRMYQENMRTILDITQNFLPERRVPVSRTTDSSSFWRDLLRNNTYSVEIERILPSLFTNTNTNNTSPTSAQITSATTVFTYDISNNPLTSQICPISLEDFRDGESLTYINHCGHVFKTAELNRWFTRNAHCPTCRYDIRRNG
jgi:hypothetical protein